MRITAFHVDGFGALASFGEDKLAPGLVVVHGPNEAGKSTLFDFLTGVLFGFPPRRDNSRFHAPVRGGRHGGRVSFVDDLGGQWVVERHAGAQRGLRVQLPDGTVGDDRDLARVLAGASSGLFRTVFAIGIDDLRQLDTLTNDEVRELLFASSVFGQRRSATTAIKQLSDARDDLARPRREDARANRLARALEDTRSELAMARREMSSFGGLSRRATEAESRVLELRERSRAQRSRERELELLMTCWKPHHRAESTRAALASVATPLPGSPEALSVAELLRLEPELDELASEISGHRERLCKLAELQYQHGKLTSSLERRIALLGSSWTVQRVLQVRSPELLAERARTARGELAELARAQATADAVLDETAGVLREVASEARLALAGGASTCGIAAAAQGDTGRALGALRQRRDEIDARRRAVHELRERVAELDEAEAAVLRSEHLKQERDRPRLVHDRVAGSATLAALVFGVMALILLDLHQPEIAAGIGAAALLAAAWATAASRHRLGSRRYSAAGGTSVSSRVTAREAGEIAGRARDRIRRLAAELGLAVPPSRVDIERLDVALQSESEMVGRLEEHGLARQKAEARVDEAGRIADAAGERHEEAERGFSEWRRTHGFEAYDTPESVLETIASIGEIKDDLAGLQRIEVAITGLERPVAEFSARLERVRLLGPEPCDGEDGTSWSAGQLEERLGALLQLAGEARELALRHAALEDELSRAEIEVADALGSGEGADGLRCELTGGRVLSWRRELEELETSREALRQVDEEAVREHQSVTEAMAHLATSDRVVALEQREAALEDELAHVLDQYLVLGIARALLRRTLSLHERERQPAVIAKAAAHFERVTAGRYVGLMPSAGADGRQTIRAVGAYGAIIDATDLSRGTIEQLYLCLRLGLADSFGERAVSLPIFLDDVLVNFDPERAQAVATELAASATGRQIIFFTCHPHLAELALKASSEGPVASQLVELSRL